MQGVFEEFAFEETTASKLIFERKKSGRRENESEKNDLIL